MNAFAKITENSGSYRKKAIIHMDGDAFFASVEQAKNWRLKGKPVVTGGERFIAASMSYEAKAKGVTRGMNLKDIRKVCPDAIILPSDYVTYTIFARRMYEIVRKYTPHVEEYSIDECFADITGLDQKLSMSYEQIAKNIKDEVERKLGITFGVGLAPTKVLAKVASKIKKPAGFTVVDRSIESFLQKIAIEKVWGIGSASSRQLRGAGIMTALDFAKLDTFQLAALNISKPYREIHHELNGISVLAVHTTKKESGQRELPKSIMCSRTFTPPSRKEDIIFSHLSKNIEEACERLRFIGVKAGVCSIYIKSQDFRYYRYEHIFERPTDDTANIVGMARQYFNHIYKKHIEYRATGVSMRGFVPKDIEMKRQGLFDPLPEPVLSDSSESSMDSISKGKKDPKGDLYQRIDSLNRKFGQHSVLFGSSLAAILAKTKNRYQKQSNRADKKGKTWAIPFLGTCRGESKNE